MSNSFWATTWSEETCLQLVTCIDVICFLQVFRGSNYAYTMESGYLVHMPDESTPATCMLDNGLAAWPRVYHQPCPQ